jgi:hypothetical protein
MIGVSRGTTNEKALRDLASKFQLQFELVGFDDHEQASAALEAGRIDGYASDEVLLYGLIAKHNAGKKFKVAGELLSYEPYSIMFRRNDPQLRDAVMRAFQKLVIDRDFIPLYQKWFMSRLPGGERLNIPMNPQFEQSLEFVAARCGAKLASRRALRYRASPQRRAPRRTRRGRAMPTAHTPRLSCGLSHTVALPLMSSRIVVTSSAWNSHIPRRPAG